MWGRKQAAKEMDEAERNEGAKQTQKDFKKLAVPLDRPRS